MAVAVAAAVLNEKLGIEKAGAEASKTPCGSHRRDADEEAGRPVPYATVVGEGQRVPSDLVPAQYLVHFAPSHVISVHLNMVGKCCVSCFALGSCFRSHLVSEGQGLTLFMQEEKWSKKKRWVISGLAVVLEKSRKEVGLVERED